MINKDIKEYSFSNSLYNIDNDKKQFRVLNCDVFQGLKKLQEEEIKVDCIVTSPPYWGLRDYGVEGQLGLEKHPQEYINNLVNVFRESKKVLKDSGSLWLNLGDTYFSKSSSDRNGLGELKVGKKGRERIEIKRDLEKTNWLQTKQKMLMPHRVAIALQEDGWVLRNDVVWHKPSHMPSSVRDRLTNSFEFMFHFVKQKKYYYDLDAIREPHKANSFKSENQSFNYKERPKGIEGLKMAQKENSFCREGHDMQYDGTGYNSIGKNPGDFWSINPKPYPEAHFACFPPALIEKPLKATCPQQICIKCGRVRERITERTESFEVGKSEKGKVKDFKGNGIHRKVGQKYQNWLEENPKRTIGFTDCGCNAGFDSGIVLDPFVGSGTTLLEAQNQGKSGIGIELNPDYIKFIKKRLNGDEHQASLNPNKIEVIK